MRKWKILGAILTLPIMAIAGFALYIWIFGIESLINPGPLKEARTAEEAGLQLHIIRDGLEHPWALAFLDDGRMLVSERVGRLSIIAQDGATLIPISGVPDVAAKGQGGLMDVALDPDFSNNQIIYFSYAEADPKSPERAGTALAKARLVEEGNAARLEDLSIIFRQTPKVEGWGHFGSRIVFNPDGTLFLTLGERFSYKERAQDLDTTLGKIVRLNKDGSAPADNPFVGSEDALDSIWSYGHRNIQGATLHPETGVLWVNEHGPRGGDELNIIHKGRNYGWPVITWGRDYTYASIGEGTHREGMEQPIHIWTPSIAPSGMTFITTDRYGDWKGSVLIGSLAHKRLIRLILDGEKVVGEDHLLGGLESRIRDVREGPEGYLYILIDAEDGKLIRLEPRHRN